MHPPFALAVLAFSASLSSSLALPGSQDPNRLIATSLPTASHTTNSQILPLPLDALQRRAFAGIPFLPDPVPIPGLPAPEGGDSSPATSAASTPTPAASTPTPAASTPAPATSSPTSTDNASTTSPPSSTSSSTHAKSTTANTASTATSTATASTTAAPSTNDDSSSGTSLGGIIGIVVGVIFGVAALAALAFFFNLLRKRRAADRQAVDDRATHMTETASRPAPASRTADMYAGSNFGAAREPQWSFKEPQSVASPVSPVDQRAYTPFRYEMDSREVARPGAPPVRQGTARRPVPGAPQNPFVAELP